MKNYARSLYKKMSDGDKAVIAFGMTPSWAVDKLEAYMSGYEIESKDYALVFMEIAGESGNVGMVV